MTEQQVSDTRTMWTHGDQEALIQRVFNEPKGNALTGLTTNQRAIYLHFLRHKAKRTGRPCLLPPYTGRADRIHEYFTALQRLEERGLVTIDRRPANYKSWTISGPR